MRKIEMNFIFGSPVTIFIILVSTLNYGCAPRYSSSKIPPEIKILADKVIESDGEHFENCKYINRIRLIDREVDPWNLKIKVAEALAKANSLGATDVFYSKYGTDGVIGDSYNCSIQNLEPDEVTKNSLNKFNLRILEEDDLNNSDIKLLTATIFTILTYTQELRIHQMNGETKNQVLLHKDGHREAVYSGDGSLVDSCPNKGTYNFYHPRKTPLGHFAADILPWLVEGSCKDDPSTVDQRVEAYVLDLMIGFDRALNSGHGFFLPVNFTFKEHGESIGFFLKAIERSRFDFNNFVPKNIQNKSKQKEFFKAIEDGFKALVNNG